MGVLTEGLIMFHSKPVTVRVGTQVQIVIISIIGA